MSALTDLMRAASADPLHYAHQHAGSGGRVIGLVGADVPVEVVVAAGAMPLVLTGLAEAGTPQADRYLEPSFTPHLRSITEQWLQGRFDFVEAVIFSRGDDSAQRCYYYLCELRRGGLIRGPAPLIFDIAKIPRASSLAHTEAAVLSLSQALSSDGARLPEVIAARDRRRSLFARLGQLRHSAHPPPGSECERLLRLADTVPAERFDRELAAWLGRDFPQFGGPRVLLAGTTPPDGRLHEAVERAGGCIVGEIDDAGLDRLGLVIGECSDPIASLARHYHSLSHGPRGFRDHVSSLVSRAAECAADGVISWLIEEDEASTWHVPASAAALSAARIPLLSLTRRRWDGHDGALEEIVSFTQGLRKRS